MVSQQSTAEVMHAFLTDALRLNQEAMECVRQLSEQARHKRVSPAQIRSLSQLIHTLKGTASLVGEAGEVSAMLHSLEDQIAGAGDVLALARDPRSWLPQTQSVLEETLDFLGRLQRRERYAVRGEEAALVTGFLARTRTAQGAETLWFPMECVSRVYSPEQMQGSTAMTVGGRLLPVLWPAARSLDAPVFGLAVRSLAGAACVAVESIEGLCSWGDAQAKGAQAGLDWLEQRLGWVDERARKSA